MFYRFWVVSVAVILSIMDIKHGASWNIINLRHMGIGEAVGSHVISLKASLLAAVLIANFPQTILSYFYVMFNNLYTCMIVGCEWSQYGLHRKPLRVSSPIGGQRSTYWLQLPYRYSIPMLIISSALSWLASQSLFFVQIEVRDYDGSISDQDAIRGCGYSPGAILMAMGVCSFIVVATGTTGFRRYPKGAMTFAGTSSAAISAACHPPSKDTDASILPVRWGVFSTKDGIGQCSFSSKLVAPPIPGRRYGGTL